MRFGILKLLTLHSIKIEDKDQQVPKGKTKKKEGEEPKNLVLKNLDR
jgi:hypothetical protein